MLIDNWDRIYFCKEFAMHLLENAFASMVYSKAPETETFGALRGVVAEATTPLGVESIDHSIESHARFSFRSSRPQNAGA
jgi:hypothetical protein